MCSCSGTGGAGGAPASTSTSSARSSAPATPASLLVRLFGRRPTTSGPGVRVSSPAPAGATAAPPRESLSSQLRRTAITRDVVGQRRVAERVGATSARMATRTLKAKHPERSQLLQRLPTGFVRGKRPPAMRPGRGGLVASAARSLHQKRGPLAAITRRAR